MIEGSYRSWDLYTTGQLVDGLQQKRKSVFIKRKWNHVVFSKATILLFHPVKGSYRSWDLDTTDQLVDGLQQKKENRFSLDGIVSSFLGRQLYRSILYVLQWVPSDVVVNVLDCDIVVNEFKLHLHYYVYFWTFGKGMNSLISFSYGLNSTTIVLLLQG